MGSVFCCWACRGCRGQGGMQPLQNQGIVHTFHAKQALLAGFRFAGFLTGHGGDISLLGVEGVDDALIQQGLHTALAAAPLQAQQQNTDPITYTDLYEWGLSGSANASERRRTFLRILGLPPRLSKKEIIQVLNTLYTRAALQVQLQAMK